MMSADTTRLIRRADSFADFALRRFAEMPRRACAHTSVAALHYELDAYAAFLRCRH